MVEITKVLDTLFYKEKDKIFQLMLFSDGRISLSLVRAKISRIIFFENKKEALEVLKSFCKRLEEEQKNA
jgi:hypothetical protein